LEAQIGELDRDFASDVIVDRRRDANAARLCDALKPRRNIHAVAKNVMRLDDDVADVNAYTVRNAPVFQVAGCKFMNVVLELQGRSNRFDRARKLRQEPVPGVLDNAAAVFGDCWVDGLR
jgi:hypothetical protein